MFKLEHNEALILIQIVEANTFQGKDVEMIAKLLGKIKREANDNLNKFLILFFSVCSRTRVWISKL